MHTIIAHRLPSNHGTNPGGLSGLFHVIYARPQNSDIAITSNPVDVNTAMELVNYLNGGLGVPRDAVARVTEFVLKAIAREERL